VRIATQNIQGPLRAAAALVATALAAAGLVEVWRNGRKVVRRKHVAPLYYGQGVYLKQGFYRAPAGWTSVVFHDGLRRYSRRPPTFRY
jgi:hypothetical protein